MMATNHFSLASKFGVVALILLSTTSAFTKDPNTNSARVPIPVVNASFETPQLIPNTFTRSVPGWQPLGASTEAGVLRPTNQFYRRGKIDGSNILYIDSGGVGQQLSATVQPATDYSLSATWGQRLDVMVGAVALQFVVGDQVVATCAPPYGPGAGKFAVIRLVYHSGAGNPGVGQPLGIRIVKRDDVSIPSPIVGSGWWSQVDIGEVSVTARAHSGERSKHISECTTSIVENALESGGKPSGSANSASADPPTDVALMNPSFEYPTYLTPGTWIDYVPGWAPADGSEAGVWWPEAAAFSANTPIEGHNILWVNLGSVSQELPIRLQAMTDYSFSVDWGHRLNLTSNAALVLQFVAGGQVLASCAPPAGPDPGQWATVTLVYHSDGSSIAVGQPLTIQIGKLGNLDWGTQVDADNARVTFTDLTGASSSVVTNAQECSMTTYQ